MSHFSDSLQSSVISPNSVIPTSSDLLELNKEFAVFCSRCSVLFRVIRRNFILKIFGKCKEIIILIIFLLCIELLFSTWRSLKIMLLK